MTMREGWREVEKCGGKKRREGGRRWCIASELREGGYSFLDGGGEKGDEVERCFGKRREGSGIVSFGGLLGAPGREEGRSDERVTREG